MDQSSTPISGASSPCASSLGTFESFKFNPSIEQAIQRAGYTAPTPIQAKAIPHILTGRDVIGLAQTGTGKTAAFMLPAFERLIKHPGRGVRVLIIAPTRELVDQINETVRTLGANLRLRSTTIYGGVAMGPQVYKLRAGVEIVVACPGRLLDHIQQRTIDLRNVEMLVLDEADHMFDMGFLPTIQQILRVLPNQRQSLLFSATMPKEIERLAANATRDPITVRISNTAPVETVAHSLFRVQPEKKPDLLFKLLPKMEARSVLIFTRTKHRAKRLAQQLQKLNHRATALHGNLSQNRRQEALHGFRKGRFSVLVATDIAARGLDISEVSHVINFDIPDTVEAYTHRIGRTGRAARTGDAYTFVTHEDTGMVRALERVLGYKIPEGRFDSVAATN